MEIKNSRVGKGSKVPHLSYLGDATIGRDVNIGAGTITVNYDGFDKHRTVVGDGAKVGSDTMLVAPVKVGKRAFTGAGSAITRNVPDGRARRRASRAGERPGLCRQPRGKARASRRVQEGEGAPQGLQVLGEGLWRSSPRNG